MEEERLLEQFHTSAGIKWASYAEEDFEKICELKLEPSKDAFDTYRIERIRTGSRRYTYIPKLIRIMKKHKHYPKEIFYMFQEIIKRYDDPILQRDAKMFLREVLILYCYVQLYKPRKYKYKQKSPIVKSWYDSKILEPKLVATVMAYI